MDLLQNMPNVMAVSSTVTALLVVLVAVVAYVGFRSDVMGASAKQLFLALVVFFFAAGAVSVTFMAFPDLGRGLYFQINRIG
jgi:hypothetical protein